MPTLIDRRLNPKDKSLGNRQRFLKRAREELKRADIIDWLNALEDEGYAASTIRGTYYILADALDAVKADLLLTQIAGEN